MAQVYVTHSNGRPLRLQPGTIFMFGSSTFDIKADDIVDGRRLRLSISSIYVMNYYFAVEIINSGEQKFTQYSVKIQAKVRKAQFWSNGHGLSALGKSRRVVIKFPPHLASNAVDVTLDLKNAKEATAKALSLENKTGTALFSSNGAQEQLHFDSAGCIEFLITYDGEAKKVIGQQYELTIRMRNHSTVIYDKKLDIVVRSHHYESRNLYSTARAEAGKCDIDLLMGLK